jgi:hypothetical protein
VNSGRLHAVATDPEHLARLRDDREHLAKMRSVFLAKREMLDRAIELIDDLEGVTSISVSFQIDEGVTSSDMQTVSTALAKYGRDTEREPVGEDRNPGGVAGVRRILQADPGKGFTAEELAQAMQADGWATNSQDPARAARAAANRLRKEEGSKVFLRNKRFVYEPDADQPRLLGEGDGGSDAAPE